MPPSYILEHLIAGGFSGTFAAIVTCPLEVVKTRLQSSVSHFNIQSPPSIINRLCTIGGNVTNNKSANTRTNQLAIWRCIRHICQTEGILALFKGLGMNLIGVAPSRAIYFATYSNSKNLMGEVLPPDSPIFLTHAFSAAMAGFLSCTITNPVWFVKTRLQLDAKIYGQRQTVMNSIRSIYKVHGIKGFYKGITASYFGISDTIIYFVIYEHIKELLRSQAGGNNHMAHYVIAATVSKTCSTVIAYPHEVARTRLREEGTKYTGFVQTIALVFKEEGFPGLYRGLGIQLVRQIPNTGIMMSAYEGFALGLTTGNVGAY